MPQKHGKQPAVLALILLLVFLCVIPAVSHAVQPSGTLPEPTCSYEVSPGTAVAKLRTIFDLTSDMKITVRKTDGGVRTDGSVETGDRAVITDSRGNMVDCIAIIVKGQPAPSSEVSSGPGESSSPVSSEAPTPVSSGNPSQNLPETSSASSEPTSSPSSGTDPVFADSVRVESLPALFGSEAACVSVFTPSGAKRESGFVCTGDIVVLGDKNGNAIRTVKVTVLGDLTRCGAVTENGCSLLYGYLTGLDSLPGDLLAAADMNRDGRVDTADLLKMKMKLRGAASSGGS